MDLKIGIAESPQVIDIELPEDVDRDALKADLEAKLAADEGVIWVTDRKGREVGVPAGQISFVQLGAGEGERQIGFGA